MNIKIKKLPVFFLLLALLASCDLDLEPENTYVDEKVYRNQRTAQAALMGSYVRLNVFLSGAPQDQNNYSNQGDVFLLGDLTTDNLKVNATSTSFIAVEQSQYSQNEHDGLLYNMWHWGYNAIDYANNIIAGITRYGHFDEATERQYVAEAKFQRAYEYLGLLSIFGDQALLGNDSGAGVVLRLNAYNGYNPDKPQARSTNAQCWQQIIADLTEAIPDLPDAVPAANARTRANKAVAEALLSRVYLYKGTYTNNRDDLQAAADNARLVLQAGYGFASSSSEYRTNLFPSNEYSQQTGYPNPTAHSEEVLFYEPSRIYTDAYPNGLNLYYRKTAFQVPASAEAQYDTADVRRTQLIGQGSPNDNPRQRTSLKYDGGEYNDVVYLRLAEVKLTLAEALVRLSGAVSDEALQQLNDVHQQAYPDGLRPAPFTQADFASPEAFLRQVLKERRLELAYEGHYRWDLMRTGNLLGDATLGAIPQNRWNLPVPQYEIRITSGVIKQNSGYLDE